MPTKLHVNTNEILKTDKLRKIDSHIPNYILPKKNAIHKKLKDLLYHNPILCHAKKSKVDDKKQKALKAVVDELFNTDQPLQERDKGKLLIH